MELKGYQKERLPDIRKQIKREYDKVWGLLPPSNERNEIMSCLRRAELTIQLMLLESEEKGE